MKKFRTPAEQVVAKNIEKIFTASPDPIEVRLRELPEVCTKAGIWKRFLALYEISDAYYRSKALSLNVGSSRDSGS